MLFTMRGRTRQIPIPVQISKAFPFLSHLSLNRTLISETNPTFRNPRQALKRQRIRAHSQPKTAAAASVAVVVVSDGSSDTDSDAVEPESGELPVVEAPSASSVASAVAASALPATATGALGGPVPFSGSFADWRNQRRAARKADKAANWAAKGLNSTPPHTTVAGWNDLLRLPRGLFSLDIGACALSYASYSLLRAHVADLRAAKVPSPAEAAASTVRRSAKQAARSSGTAVSGAAATWVMDMNHMMYNYGGYGGGDEFD